MLADQEATKRLTKPQSGSCLHCHASVMPLYRELGGGDVMKGFEATPHDVVPGGERRSSTSWATRIRSPASTATTPKTMELRVTRPGFIRGIQALAAERRADAAPAEHRALARGRRAASPTTRTATRRAARCARSSAASATSSTTARAKMPLTFPWGKGLTRRRGRGVLGRDEVPRRRALLRLRRTPRPARQILKAQHPEFELWSQGIHARSGVACADCHMPYMRDGAAKISDHWVRSPLLNVNRACQVCHHFPEEEIQARVAVIQDRNHELLQRAAAALMDLLDAIAAREGGRRERRAARRRAGAPAAARSGASTSSRPRTRWASTLRRRPRACSARRPTTRARDRSRR